MPTTNSWGNQVLNANVLFNGGTFGAGTDATSGAISIGTGAAARTTTIGNIIGATAVNINTGTGGSAITTTNGTFAVATGTGTINIGTDTVAKTINIGNATGTSSFVLTAGNGPCTLTTSNGTLTLSTGTGALGLGTDGAAKTVTVGNIIGATNIAINTGTGGMAVASASGTLMNVTGTGIMTRPLQPCFLAYRSATVANVTGDNTLYQIINNTEAFDLGSNYNNGTGVFTAPVTGKYLFCSTVCCNGFVAQTNGAISIVTTARTYTGIYGNWGALGNNSGTCTQTFSIIADMSANDTAYFTVQIGGSTKTLGLVGGGTSVGTYCSGCLLC
jgi:hypothetical protein